MDGGLGSKNNPTERYSLQRALLHLIPRACEVRGVSGLRLRNPRLREEKLRACDSQYVVGWVLGSCDSRW